MIREKCAAEPQYASGAGVGPGRLSALHGYGVHTHASEQVEEVALVERLTGGGRRILEAWCCLAAAGFVGFLAWWALDLVAQSWRFGDISPGLLAIPFWIPQAAMAFGLLLLTLALVDEAVGIVRGREPAYASGEDTALDD